MTAHAVGKALWRLPVQEALQRIRAGELTCAALMRAYLAHCAAREPAIQAWVHFDAGRAMERAEAADARLQQGAAPGALHGLPLAVKDIIDVAGMPTRMGSEITDGEVAAASAECVARLEAAGAIVLGKSVTTEFAYYSPGKTRNPWNAAHTPGGSSSGSAAAVASGMAAAALGTQTNGSVIRPAAFCGVVGYKPSFGAVSNHGTLDPWPSLDHTGVIARTVSDAALLAGIIARPDTPIRAGIGTMSAPRLAAVRSPVWELAEPAQRDSLEACIGRLRSAGATVTEEELPPGFDEAHGVMRIIMAYEAAAHFGTLRRKRGDGMSAQLTALIDEGSAIDEPKYRAALALQRRLREAFAPYIARFDALITPPAPGEAPATLEQTGSPAFCSIWSLLGVPALTLPAGLGPRGLPLGLQLAAAYRDDDTLLAAAAWCERQLLFTPLYAMDSP